MYACIMVKHMRAVFYYYETKTFPNKSVPLQQMRIHRALCQYIKRKNIVIVQSHFPEHGFQMWTKTSQVVGSHVNHISQFTINQLKNSAYLSHLNEFK